MSRKNCASSVLARPKMCNQTPRHSSTKHIKRQGTIKVKAKHLDYTTEARNNFLLDSLAACNDVNSKLVMYYYSEYSFCQLPWLSQQSFWFIEGYDLIKEDCLQTDFAYFFAPTRVWS